MRFITKSIINSLILTIIVDGGDRGVGVFGSTVGQVVGLHKSPGPAPKVVILGGCIDKLPHPEGFSELVTEYFINNFGKAGENYLKSIFSQDLQRDQNCQRLLNDSRTGHAEFFELLKYEANEIRDAFTPRGMIAKKKETWLVRYRIHRFIGILEFLRLYDTDKLWLAAFHN